MNAKQVIALLKTNQNELSIKKWNQRNSNSESLKSFGIGLTQLRKLAKQVGKDHNLSLQLWETDIYDAKIIAILIDDPKQITREQTEKQVEGLKLGHLAHVYSSCGAPLAKVSFVKELTEDWINSRDTLRRSCGYGLLYELSKSQKKNAPKDIFFLEQIDNINRSFSEVNNIVLGAMGGALMGMGKRNAKLNKAALKVAKSIGPISIEIEGSNCEPFDVVKHLTSDYIREKLGVK